MSDLTVVSVVANDRGLIDIMVESVLAFTNPTPKIILGDNGGNGDLAKRYANHPHVEVKQLLKTPDYGGRLAGVSNLHGWALNAIVPSIMTPRIAIIESDCAVLRDGWDDTGDSSIIAAVKGHDKDLVLYHVCCIVGNSTVLRVTDWSPGTEHTRRSNKSYQIYEDVGWMLGFVVDPNEVRKLEFVDTKTGKGQILDASFCSDEFWLDGKATFAHYGRGSNIGSKRVRKGFVPHQEQLENFKKAVRNVIDEKDK